MSAATPLCVSLCLIKGAAGQRDFAWLSQGARLDPADRFDDTGCFALIRRPLLLLQVGFPRPGHNNDMPPLYENSPLVWAEEGLPPGAVNIAPVAAGDFLILSEATVHAILPWQPSDRLRRILALRYGTQYSGTQPLLKLPPQVAARLSDTTQELMSYAHITHTKNVAMEYRISSAAPRL